MIPARVLDPADDYRFVDPTSILSVAFRYGTVAVGRSTDDPAGQPLDRGSGFCIHGLFPPKKSPPLGHDPSGRQSSYCIVGIARLRYH